MLKLLFISLLVPSTLIAQSISKKISIVGTGKVLVILPGAMESISDFTTLAQKLSAQLKVVTMQNINVQFADEGNVLPDDYSIKMEMQSIKTTLDSLEIYEPVHFVGNGFGGLMALEFAKRYPLRTSSVILVGVPFYHLLAVNNADQDMLQKATKTLEALTPKATISNVDVQRWLCLQKNCNGNSTVQKSLPSTLFRFKNRLRGQTVTLDYQVNEESLNRLNKKILIITGTQSVPVQKKIDELMYASLHTSKRVFMEGGNALLLTNPTEMSYAISNFLK